MKLKALSCNHWFFGIVKILKNAIVLQVIEVFAKHGLNAHVIIYVKEERGDLSTMITILIHLRI
jgi:hypothetical protein